MIFIWATKSFGKILLGHEVFWKNFDGLQNLFLIIIILFISFFHNFCSLVISFENLKLTVKFFIGVYTVNISLQLDIDG